MAIERTWVSEKAGDSTQEVFATNVDSCPFDSVCALQRKIVPRQRVRTLAALLLLLLCARLAIARRLLKLGRGGREIGEH